MSDHLPLTPTEKLLIALCRLNFSEEEKRKVGELMSQVTDWDEFVTLSNEQGIIALCWYNIVETGNSDLIPSEYLKKLHSGYLKSLARNTAIYKLLDEVLEIARQENIKVVLLKGLLLEKTLYGNKGLRQMNDLDILVKREDAIKLRKLLLDKGFESMPMISPLHERILPYYGKHLPEMYKKGFSVEIHFRLFDLAGEELTKEFIDTSHSDDGEGFFIPDTGMNFLYLVKHLARHEITGNLQLRLYADLLNLIAQNGTGLFSDLEKKIDSSGLKVTLGAKLLILKEIFGADIDNSRLLFLTQYKEVIIGKFLKSFREKNKPDQSVSSESLLKPLKDFRNTKAKLLYVTGYLFPSIAFMKYRYSAYSVFKALMFYPVRWAKLVTLMLNKRL